MLNHGELRRLTNEMKDLGLIIEELNGVAYLTKTRRGAKYHELMHTLYEMCPIKKWEQNNTY
jgi:hypothetical protein